MVRAERTATSKSMPYSDEVMRVRTCFPGAAWRTEAGLRKSVLVDCLPDASERVTAMRLSESGW